MNIRKSDSKLRIGAAVLPLMEPFQAVAGKLLLAVDSEIVDGCICALSLVFDDLRLEFRAVEEDDSVEIGLVDSSLQSKQKTDMSRSEPWAEFLSTPFAWGWITVNQQGYCDGVMLSFGTIEPRIVLNVVASSIRTRMLTAT